MNLITATPQLVVYALGWTLLHFLWQGTLVALILACVLALLGERSPQPRYLAACTALLLIVAAPIATFSRIVAQNRPAHRIVTFTQLDPIIIDATGAPSQPVLQRIAAVLDHAMPIVLILWLTGVFLLLSRLAIGLVVARRMKSVATQPPPRDLLAAFHQLGCRIGVSRPVRLLNSALVQVPTVIGWLRPVVLIPLGCLAGLSPAQIEAILAHELAHIRRHDYLISVLQSTVEALLFYHPAVWWVSRRIRIEREHCCDDLAVHIGGDPLTYARALSLLAEQSAALPTLTLAATGGVLTMRIKRLFAPRQTTVASQLAAATLLALTILATGLCVATAVHAENKLESETRHRLPLNRNISRAPEAPVPAQLALTGNKNDPYLGTNEAQTAQPAAPSRIRVSSGVLAGQVLSRVNPIYPPDAKSAHIQGAVVLRAVISRSGDIIELEAISGPEELRASALEAVHQWKYRPYILNGEPTEVATTITVNYTFGETSANQANQPPPYAGTAAPTNAVRLSAGVVRGAKISGANPTYPQAAKTAHIQGAVVLHVVVSKTGDIVAIEPLSGPEELRASAITAVRTWKYHPYVINGEPQDVDTTITVNYHLSDNASSSVPLYAPGDQPASSGPTADPVTPKKVGDGVSSPRLLFQAAPDYSEQAKQDKISGKVLLNLWVDEQGNPTHVTIVRGIGHGLDEKAIEAIKQYKFSPALENGKPVTVALNIEVNFQRF